MSTNTPTIARPDSQIVNTGQVPNDTYTILFTGGKDETSKSSGNRHIVASFEIVAPDLVELPDGRKSQVAAKKGKIYMSVDERSKQYQQWYEAYGRLQLLEADGNINVANICAKLDSKKVFAYVVLNSEERIQRKPARPGQDVGDIIYHPITKKPLTSGWDFKYIGPDAILCIDPSGGLGNATAAAAVNRPY